MYCIGGLVGGNVFVSPMAHTVLASLLYTISRLVHANNMEATCQKKCGASIYFAEAQRCVGALVAVPIAGCASMQASNLMPLNLRMQYKQDICLKECQLPKLEASGPV